MCGALQKAIKNPKYSGWPTRRYDPGVRNVGGSYVSMRQYFQACLSPNISKRTISTVQVKSNDQPHQNNNCKSITATGLRTVQITPGRGCQNCTTARRTRLATSTYVLRSNKGGTNFVHVCLKPWRAIPLCCTAKNPSKLASISSAWLTGDCGARLSMVQTNQIAREKTPRRNTGSERESVEAQ